MKNLITTSAPRTVTLLYLLLFTLLAASAPAATFYWDPNGASAPTDGTWDTTSHQWSSTSALSASPVVWNSANAACFVAGGADPGTITITVNSAITTAGIFNGNQTGAPGVTTLDFIGAGSLSFTGIQGFSVAAGKSTYFDIPLTGAGAIFTAEGSGDMYLRTANTYSGGTYLGYSSIPFTGILHFDNPGFFGPGTITVTNTTGGRATLAAVTAGTLTNAVNVMSSHTLAINAGGNALAFSGNISGGGSLIGDAGSSPGLIEFDAAMAFTGTTTITNGTLQMGDGSSKNGNLSGNIAVTSLGFLVWANPGAVTYTKVMSGNGSFTYQGPGVLTLSGANTYTSPGSLNAGTVKLGVNNALPSGSVVSINAGATLDLGGYSATIKGLADGVSVPGTVSNSSTNTSTLTLGNTADATFSGTITDGLGPVGLTKNGAATQVLGGANTYSWWTVVNSGILQPSADNAFSPNSSVYLPGPGILDLQYHSETIGALSGIGIVSNFYSGTLTVSGNAAANGSQDYNRYSCILNTLVGYDNFSPASGNLVKGGTHAMAIRTNLTSSLAGSLTLNQGTLSVGVAPEMLPTMSLTVPSGATFQLDANSQTLSSLNGNGKINLGGGTLNLAQNGDDTFSGTIQNSDLNGSSTAAGHGLRGYYFTNIDLTGLAAVRDDSTVNLTNMATLPWGYVDNVSKTNQVSGRWLGQVLTTVAGTYAFVPATDDGQRLWVNGALMVNDWTPHGISPKTNTLALAANTRYDLVFEWFNNGGPGAATLSWMPPGSTTPTIIPSANLFLPGAGTLVMNGTGTQHLGGASTYTGGTTVSSGTLDAQVNGALGGGSVIVSNLATLRLDATATMSSGADLVVASGGTVNLNYTGTQTIRALSLDGGSTWRPAGTYSHTTNPTVFQGAGQLNVAAGPTSVGLVSSPVSTAVYGTPVTLTATLNPTAATGTVTFYDGSNWLGSGTVSSGIATLTVSNLMVSAAGHSLKAVYNGDATRATSSSSTVTVTTTPATVTPTIVTSPRAYDASTTNFTVIPPTVLSGVLPGDVDYVFLQTSGSSLSVTSKVVGTNKTATFTGARVLTGSLATNYVVTTGTIATTVTITNKVLTVTGLTGSNKTYDGTTAATVTGAILQPTETAGSGTGTDGKPYQGDSISLSGTATGTFASKTVGTGKTITVTGYSLTGTDAPNYSFAPTTTTANINPATLTVTGLTANGRTYDATTNATLSGAAVLNGVVGGDTVTLGGTPTASFADKNAGNNKAVTVTGYSVSGGDASNYTLNQPSGLTASISSVATTVTISSSANPATPGSSVTITARVTANPLPAVPDAPVGTWTMQTNSVTITPAPTVVSNSTGVAIGTFSGTSWKLGANPVLAFFSASGGNYKSSVAPVYFTQIVQTATCSLTNRILSVTPNGGNSYTLNLIGTPAAQYYIVSSTSVAPTSWVPVPGSTNSVINGNGLWSVTVTNPAPAFYRSRATSVCP